MCLINIILPHQPRQSARKRLPDCTATPANCFFAFPHHVTSFTGAQTAVSHSASSVSLQHFLADRPLPGFLDPSPPTCNRSASAASPSTVGAPLHGRHIPGVPARSCLVPCSLFSQRLRALYSATGRQDLELVRVRFQICGVRLAVARSEVKSGITQRGQWEDGWEDGWHHNDTNRHPSGPCEAIESVRGALGVTSQGQVDVKDKDEAGIADNKLFSLSSRSYLHFLFLIILFHLHPLFFSFSHLQPHSPSSHSPPKTPNDHHHVQRS